MTIKKEDLTIVIILILVIVGLIYIIPKFSGSAISIPCVDSDGGKVYTVQGTVQKGVSVKVTDYCIDSIQLREHYCSDNQFKAMEVDYYDCPNGCVNGACVQKATSASSGGQLSAEKGFLTNGWFWIILIVILVVLFIIFKIKKK